VKFTPLWFQGALASAGVALMPYTYLKASVSTPGSDPSLGGLGWQSLSPAETAVALSLVAIMGLFVAIHLALTALFLKELVAWLRRGEEVMALAATPLANAGLFSPLVALPMTMLVVFGPIGFFVPWIGESLQSLMLPAFLVFAILWSALVALAMKVVRVQLLAPIPFRKYHFGWLLDVLAFGAVSLLGANVMSNAHHPLLANAAALMIAVTLALGFATLIVKVPILVYHRLLAKQATEPSVLPAIFLVVPPMCLLGFSLHKLAVFAGGTYDLDVGAIPAVILLASYALAMGWFLLSIVVLREYLCREFLRAEFSPAQWGIV